MDLGESTVEDRPTTRFYCSECFTPTLEVQLAAASREIEWERVKSLENKFSLTDIATVLNEGEGWGQVSEMVSFQDLERVHSEEVSDDDSEELPW